MNPYPNSESRTMHKGELEARAEREAVAFEEPASLFNQEQASLEALQGFRRLAADFLTSVEACALDYAELSRANRALAEAAQALAGELFKTAGCYAMARAIGDAQDAGAVLSMAGAS